MAVSTLSSSYGVESQILAYLLRPCTVSFIPPPKLPAFGVTLVTTGKSSSETDIAAISYQIKTARMWEGIIRERERAQQTNNVEMTLY